MPLDAAFFQAGPVLVVTCASTLGSAYQAADHEVLSLPGSDGQVDLRRLLEQLATRGVNDLLVEAGPRLAGAFARQGLVDEYQIFIAGRFLGSTARPLLDWPLERMSEAPRLKITEMRAVGDDWRVSAIPDPAPGV